MADLDREGFCLSSLYLLLFSVSACASDASIGLTPAPMASLSAFGGGAASRGGAAQTGTIPTGLASGGRAPEGDGGTGGSLPAGGATHTGGVTQTGGAGGTTLLPPVRVCVNQRPPDIDCGPDCVALVNNGPVNNRVSLAIVGEGFDEKEVEEIYGSRVDDLQRYMFTNTDNAEPYVRYKRFVNLYRIDAVSPESGVDDPSQGIEVDTPLDGEAGCTDYRIGMCQVNWEKAHDAFAAAIAGSDVERIDWRWIMLNQQGNCGNTHHPQRGNLTVYCPYDSASLDIALHEAGHGFHALADTYWTIDGAFPKSEPSQVNLTKDSTGKKWERWLDFDDPVLGKVGAFEGGGQYTKGVYRPSRNQKMGSAEFCHNPGEPHCPHDVVSREKILLDIYDLVSPLDGWLDETEPLKDPEKLWVDVVDCEVQQVDWTVDGKLVAEDFGEEFVPRLHGVAPGTHQISAIVHDDTPWVRLDRAPLTKTVTWTVESSF